MLSFLDATTYFAVSYITMISSGVFLWTSLEKSKEV